MKKEKNEINQLAIDYFLEGSSVKKFGILLKAERILSEYQFKSYSAFKKDFGFSYFAGLNSSQKTVKGLKENFNTLILYLSASKNAGKGKFGILKAKVTKGMSAGKEEKFILSFSDLVALIDCLKENSMAA